MCPKTYNKECDNEEEHAHDDEDFQGGLPDNIEFGGDGIDLNNFPSFQGVGGLGGGIPGLRGSLPGMGGSILDMGGLGGSLGTLGGGFPGLGGSLQGIGGFSGFSGGGDIGCRSVGRGYREFCGEDIGSPRVSI